MSDKNDQVLPSQRALIFQGGGSLGAYEAGAYKAIYEELSKEYKKELEHEQPLFHVVAGTSIGAVNASILVSYVKENKRWEGSAEKLIEFWRYVSTESSVDKMGPSFDTFWNFWHNVDKRIASSESARRYFSTKEFIFRGVPAAFHPKIALHDTRFLDPTNTWYMYSHEPLKKTLEKFAKFPIATSFGDNEPRLLLTSIDVQAGLPVVFDSYCKEDGSRRTFYGRGVHGQQFEVESQDPDEIKRRQGKGKRNGSKYLISYDDGIRSEFVMASCSVPINYDYAKLEVIAYSNTVGGGNQDEPKQPRGKKTTRYFWDGGLLAYTPLGETIISHTDYWTGIKKYHDAPPLQVCIVNIHPAEQEYLPSDLDGIIDRKNDLIYHDRTEFDERIAVLVSDYVTFVRCLIKLANEKGVSKDSIDEILQKKAHFRNFTDGTQVTYGDLEKARPAVEFVYRIERKNDIHTVANKIFDFSAKTIEQLVTDGYQETREEIKENRFPILDWSDNP
jgi:predicted acylesterase/phospholipase RssA